MGEIIYFAVGNIAAHDGFVASRDADRVWHSETGAHGTILYEGPSAKEAGRAPAEWLKCDTAARGRYCYTHNPCGR